MSWVRLDDGFPDHPKVVRLDDAAFRLHVTAMCYAARAGTDGFVPAAMVARLHPEGAKLTKQLVSAGVWETREGGFEVHDYLDYNLSKAEGEARRAKRVAAGQLGGRRSGEARRSPESEANAEANPEANASGVASTMYEAKPNPVPVPVPVPGVLEAEPLDIPGVSLHSVEPSSVDRAKNVSEERSEATERPDAAPPEPPECPVHRRRLMRYSSGLTYCPACRADRRSA